MTRPFFRHCLGRKTVTRLLSGRSQKRKLSTHPEGFSRIAGELES